MKTTRKLFEEMSDDQIITNAMLRQQDQDRIEELEAENAALRAALEVLIREAQAVADDCHRPRYYRLDQALESAIDAARKEKP